MHHMYVKFHCGGKCKVLLADKHAIEISTRASVWRMFETVLRLKIVYPCFISINIQKTSFFGILETF